MASASGADTDLISALERAAATATVSEIAKLLADLEQLKAVLWQRLVHAAAISAEPPPGDPLEDLRHLTPAQASELLNLKEPYIHELCRTGRLPATKSGKYWMIPVAGLRQWLAYQKRDVDPDAGARLQSLNPRGDSGPRPSVGPVRGPRRSLTRG